MLLFVCCASMLMASFLLFLIQPLAAKAILPVFGGVPSVWNMCLIYFQGMLLIGYFYVFCLQYVRRVEYQYMLHFLLGLLSLGMLPILWNYSAVSSNLPPAVNVMVMLVVKLSLPLFVVTTTAPLVQAWFSRTNHPHAADPYFLYSASNVGSLLALLSFPFLLEPWLGLHHMSLAWSVTYSAFLGIMFFAGLLSHANSVPGRVSKKTSSLLKHVDWQERFYWLILSFSPSALLMAVTQYVTTDIVSVPLFWVLPLALYLLAFIVVFSEKEVIRYDWLLRYQGYFLILPLLSLLFRELISMPFVMVSAHLMAFLVLTLTCVSELYCRRPEKNKLAEYYVWLALGGFLGGIFTGVIAPKIFVGIYEYYIAICLCILSRKWFVDQNGMKLTLSDFVFPGIFACIIFVNQFIQPLLNSSIFNIFFLFVLVTSFILVTIKQLHPIFRSLSLALFFLLVVLNNRYSDLNLLYQTRNFYGLKRIYQIPNEKKMHMLVQGTTVHGAERIDKSIANSEARTYYNSVEEVGKLLKTRSGARHIVVAGLGAGTASCLFTKADSVTFFEIDPDMVKLASNPNFFTYLKRCPPQGGIVIGDARLNFEKYPKHYFDLIVIDVFSSDSVPAHIITNEALDLYLSKLKGNGLILFHASSRYLNIERIISAMATKNNIIALVKHSHEKSESLLPSTWVLLTENPKLALYLTTERDWHVSKQYERSYVWTDDYSNILSALR